MQAKIQGLEVQVETLAQQLSQSGQEFEKYKVWHETEKQRELQEHKKALELRDSTKGTLVTNAIAGTHAQYATVRQELKSLTEKNVSLQTELARVNASLDSTTKENTSLKTMLERGKTARQSLRLNNSKLHTETDQLRKTESALKCKIQELERQLGPVQRSLLSEQSNHAKTAQQLLQASARTEKAEQEKRALQEAEMALLLKLDEKTTQLEAKKEEYTELLQQYGEAGKAFGDIEEQRKELATRLAAAEKKLAGYEAAAPDFVPSNSKEPQQAPLLRDSLFQNHQTGPTEDSQAPENGTTHYPDAGHH